MWFTVRNKSVITPSIGWCAILCNYYGDIELLEPNIVYLHYMNKFSFCGTFWTLPLPIARISQREHASRVCWISYYKNYPELMQWSMLAQSETRSDYKHHNTWKVLVAVTKNGQVSFISDLWGEQFSDKQITGESSVLICKSLVTI